MNSKIDENSENKEIFSKEKEVKKKVNSINIWLDDENSKYYVDNKNLNQINCNDNKLEKEISKNDILSNINKLIEENEKKDEYFISAKNNITYTKKNNYNLNNINTSDILGLTLELNETKKTNNLMKETIQELRNEVSKNQLEYKENLSNEINRIKFEYEEKIENLKNLINNLISEKQKLKNKIGEFEEQIEKKESEYKKKINELVEYYKSDNEKSKEAWFQAEKNRRKKWEENKIKQIKEMTIKNLEPELDKILHYKIIKKNY